ncbi:MAG: hypothetical protein KDA42_12255 [Planctomycetales bacterium]|nr:hypothetical protein [Planctomycetales bacterium]
MNCDHVFSILTRGPFPSGDATDRFVEAHLLHCESCRELAEALRPSPEYGPESVTNEESWELPVYWSQHGDPVLTTSDGMTATARAAVRRMVRRNRPGRPFFDRTGLRLLIAVLFGVLFGLLWQEVDDRTANDSNSARALATDATRFRRQLRRQIVESRLLDQQGLAAACYQLLPASQQQRDSLVETSLENIRYAEVACCADCHHRHGQAMHAPATSVARHCVTCHENTN